MIVADTNTIAYLLIAGERTPQAKRVLRKDPEWIAPLLWRSEFRSVVAFYLRKRFMSLPQALQINEEVTAIKVFGSFARKDFTGRSDADILIVLSDSDEEVLRRILRFRKFFEIEIPVDVLVYTEKEIEQALSQENSFIRRALNEGISL